MLMYETDRNICIHHIMWQPSFSCERKCAGCYLNEWSQHNDPDDLYALDIVDGLISGTIHCNQLTISIDKPDKISPQVVAAIKRLWTWHASSLNYGDSINNLCISAHNWFDVLGWMKVLEADVGKFMQPVSMVSLSDPTEVIDCAFLQGKLVYNCLAGSQAEAKQSFLMGVGRTTHVILKKPPLGEDVDPTALQHFKAMREYCHVYGKDITVDRCTSSTCMAGSSMAMVWPDGSVTGCPYDSHGVCRFTGPTFEALKDMRQAVRDGKRPVNHCKIQTMMLRENQ